jgi:poly-gamma-glutamate synthesis protein (capsule biosynthesis protein)
LTVRGVPQSRSWRRWGSEFQAALTRFQLDTARALTSDPDITAIVGQHVHVVQPITRVNGKLVVFGEGQLLSNQSAACCPAQTEDGMLVFLHITVDRERSKLVSIGYMPTWDRHPDYTVLPIGDALKRHEAPAGVLRASYDRTTSVVGRIPNPSRAAGGSPALDGTTAFTRRGARAPPGL